MANLIPIQTLSVDDVQKVIREAVRPELDFDAIEDFLASVDWSGTNKDRSAIADILGQLEAWGVDFASGQLPEAKYVGHLVSLLPSEERRLVG